MTSNGELRFVVCAITDPENRVLFLKRAPGKELSPKQWGLVAGHVERGEAPRACAEREIGEELGTAMRLALVRSVGPVSASADDSPCTVYLFHYRWQAGDIVLNAEHTDYKWLAAGQHRAYDLMRGVDEDLYRLDVWPYDTLNETMLPPHLRHP